MSLVPDATEYNPDPDYLRDLVDSTGLTRKQVAEEILGVTDRCLRLWLAGDRAFPYSAQFTLEQLVLGV